MTLESTRHFAGKGSLVRKPARAQATMTARQPSPAVDSRIRFLEREVHELKQQLHTQEIQNLLDLRVASGLLTEKERNQSAVFLAGLPGDALRLMRRDLVKVLQRVNGSTLSPPSTETTRGDALYIV